MTVFEAPAKLNLALLVFPPRPDGLHPLRSTVQTIEWCDVLTVEVGEGSDVIEVIGTDLDDRDNLVSGALAALRQRSRIPPLTMTLDKRIPIEAGLGGGSSDAAAVMGVAMEMRWSTPEDTALVSRQIGADVALFVVGGSLDMSGVGDVIMPIEKLDDFAVAVVVPAFGMSTAAVYQRWDALEGPIGDVVPDELLPPSLRERMPMRNDLLPAALSLEPALGDFIGDIRSIWGTAVCLTGSGSACFGYFPSVEEAQDAADAVAHLTSEGRGVVLRPHGVASA